MRLYIRLGTDYQTGDNMTDEATIEADRSSTTQKRIIAKYLRNTQITSISKLCCGFTCCLPLQAASDNGAHPRQFSAKNLVLPMNINQEI